MKALVFGASGKTGRLLVQQLLKRNVDVRIVVRESSMIPESISGNRGVEIVRRDVEDLDVARIAELLSDCDGCASCLGHTINLKGLFGHPRRLVFHTVEKITRAMQSLDRAGKFVLMSTTAYTNILHGEINSFGEKIVFAALELLLPPHKDNMLAADHLVHHVGPEARVEWVAVRPDTLVDADMESVYDIHPSKTTSSLFHPGKTSRINVSHFMAELLLDDALWQEWKFRTPVIYTMKIDR